MSDEVTIEPQPLTESKTQYARQRVVERHREMYTPVTARVCQLEAQLTTIVGESVPSYTRPKIQRWERDLENSIRHVPFHKMVPMTDKPVQGNIGRISFNTKVHDVVIDGLPPQKLTRKRSDDKETSSSLKNAKLVRFNAREKGRDQVPDVKVGRF